MSSKMMNPFLSTCLLVILTMMSASLLPALQVSSTPLHANVYPSNGLYTVTLPIGTPPQPQNLTLSFTAPISTVQCSRTAFQPTKSSTLRRLGRIFRDTLHLNRTNGMSPEIPTAAADMAFRCRSSAEAALGSGKLALPAQLAASLGNAARPVFGYCLPNGALFLGGSNDSYFVRGAPAGGFRSILFSQTTLHVSKSNRANRAGPYSISVTDVVVNAQPLNVTAAFPLYISTATSYTRLGRELYRKLRSAFRKSIGFGTRTTPALPRTRPFDTCFDGAKFGSTRVGPGVPEIDLRLSGGALWRIYGRNSVVSVGNDVLCWAFVDAGVNKPSVLGAYQQEENFVEFDLEKALFRFGGILYLVQTNCGNFHFNY